METEKVLDEEEEEEKEHFFSDLVPSDRDREGDDDEMDDDEMDEDGSGHRNEPLNPTAVPAGGGSAVGTTEQDRRAQIGASPYLAPFTPLSSPNRPKTPSSVSVAQRSVSKKPQLVPMKNGPGATAAGSAGGGAFGSSGGSGSKVLKDDVVNHLPAELVESLMTTVQTLDKLILGIEDYKADQLGFLYEKVNSYVELLKQIDTAGANYHALIPLQVLEYVAFCLMGMLERRMVSTPLTNALVCTFCRMVDGQENTNPELFTKSQLEKCQDESERAAGKVDTLLMLKEALESGVADL